MAKTTTYKDIVLENATIIRTDFGCNHHGGLYHPTIWVKVDGRSVKRLIREGYCIKQMTYRKTGKKCWILVVSASIPYSSGKSTQLRFDSKLCVECDGCTTVFDVDRDRWQLAWLDYAVIRSGTLTLRVYKYVANGREGLTAYIKEGIIHVDRYTDMLKVLDSVSRKINMFEKIPYESLKKMSAVKPSTGPVPC